MRLKTAIVLCAAAGLFVAAHYDEPVTVTVTLPSPAQVVETVGEVTDSLKDIAENSSLHVVPHEQANYAGISIPDASANAMDSIACDSEWYRVRSSWEDVAGQIGAYKELENAINSCPVGYYVFDDNGVILYDPCGN